MFYALFLGKISEEYVDEEGNRYPTGEPIPTYGTPVEFKGNIVMSGSGYSEAQEFGLNLSDYNASLITNKNSIPIDETSLVWFESEPVVDEDGHAVRESADYSVVKVSKTINEDKYILKKMVK